MRYLPVWVAMIISLFVLIGCGTTGKQFDEAKLEKIVNGSTTKKEIEFLFGPPFKTGVQNGRPTWIYEYNEYQALGKDTSKNVIVVFDDNGVVRSHQFMTSEPQH